MAEICLLIFSFTFLAEQSVIIFQENQNFVYAQIRFETIRLLISFKVHEKN